MWTHYEKLRHGDADSGSGQSALDLVQATPHRAGDQEEGLAGIAAIRPACGVAGAGEAHGRLGRVRRARGQTAKGRCQARGGERQVPASAWALRRSKGAIPGAAREAGDLQVSATKES